MSLLTQELERSLKINSDKYCFQIKRGLRRYSWTYSDVDINIHQICSFFHSQGFKPGDHFLLWGTNMPEWSIVFLAAIFYGLQTIPADPRSNWDTLNHYLDKTKPKFAIISHFLLPFFKDHTIPIFELETIIDLAKSSKPFTPTRPKANDPVEIVFTSGSSNQPKGVILTHDNLYYQFKQTNLLLPKLPYVKSVSILPLSHLYEQMYGLLWPFLLGGTISYLERINPLTIRKGLRSTHATYLLAVPQMLRIFWNNIEEQAKISGKLNQFITAQKLALYLPITFRRFIFRTIHQSFGGQLSYIASGSAPLEPKLAKKWELLGFKVVEAYGATETTGMCTVPPLDDRRFGRVGKPGHYTQLKIDNNGEILIKGPIVSPGYYHDEAKTKSSFKDGWYHSGDIGQIDSEGFLSITGRISSRLILSDGTKVYPEDIERLLNDLPDVKDSCIIGKKSGDDILVHAVILPKRPNIELDKIIKAVNLKLESKQQIFSGTLWQDRDFPRLRTLKVDRNVISEFINHQTSEKYTSPSLDLSSLNQIISSLSSRKVIRDSDKLGDDLKLDSLHRIQLAALLEQHLGVQINEISLTPQTSIAELKKLISCTPESSPSYDPETIVEHRRFSKVYQFLRSLLQKVFIFPIHAFFVPLQIIKGADLINNLNPPYLLIFNHLGMFELISILRLLPPSIASRVVTAVTSERWEDGHKFISTLIELSLAGYPFARQGPWLSAGIEATGELIDQGYSILFAPEGKMERDGKALPFMSGIGFLARSLNIKVLMFKIGDEYREIWPAPAPGRPAVAPETFLPKKRRTVSIKIGLAQYNSNDEPEKITRTIESQFKSL